MQVIVINSGIPVPIIVFNLIIANIIIIEFIKGNTIILVKSIMLHFVTLMHTEQNPMVETKILKNTANDAPTIPHLIVRG